MSNSFERLFCNSPTSGNLELNQSFEGFASGEFSDGSGSGNKNSGADDFFSFGADKENKNGADDFFFGNNSFQSNEGKADDFF